MVQRLKLKLMLNTVLLVMLPLAAKIEPKPATPFAKPTIKQLYGCYKVILGSVMVFNSLHSFTSFFHTNSDYTNSESMKNLFDNLGLDMLEGIFGAHMAYFGYYEAIKQPKRSPYLKIQSDLCNSLAVSRGRKMVFKGISLIKTKMADLFI